MTSLRPKFVSFEGPEGAGKTTQSSLLAERLRTEGAKVLLTREPGGTELGDRIRELVLSESGLPISARSETLLYCVARAQLVEERLRPALAAGKVVIVDRYADSTLAYQAFGRGLGNEEVLAVLNFATSGLRPDLTFLLDLPVELGLDRKRAGWDKTGTNEWNRFESEGIEFHHRVQEAYRELATKEPARWHIVDASGPVSAVAETIWQACEALWDQRLAADGSPRGAPS